MSKRFLRYLLVIGFLAISFGFASSVYAQAAICDPANPTNGDCQIAGFPPCFQCTPMGVSPISCIPSTDPAACDDGNPCTLDSCQNNPTSGPLGCLHQDLLESGDTTLPTECYICEPTANGVVVDNGICDEDAGENCTANPSECGIIGFLPCGTPNPPHDAPGGFFTALPGDYSTDCETITIHPAASFATIACEDGDRCTQNICTIPATPDALIGTCSNPPITACAPTSDGCCPTGCVGPTFGTSCPVGIAGTNCDPDCCSPEVCGSGDSEVQGTGGAIGETCDDSVPSGDAGIKLNGQAVTDAECRDPGTTDQCTYCGDGIFQPASEQCDVSAQALCPNGGVCTANCQCVTLAPCVQGSGCGNDSGKVQGDCDGWTGMAIGHPTGFQDYRELFAVAILGLAIVLIRSWVRKRAE